jgi:hypothetical protein
MQSDYNNFSSLIDIYNKIYVSIDMDILKGYGDEKRTNWPNGGTDFQMLAGYLEGLPEGKIIAADITGLPTGTNKTPALRDYCGEINTIAEILNRKIITR